MTYRIEFRPAAVRSLKKVDPAAQRRIQGAVTLLAVDPRPPNAVKLKGREGYRVRVGEYRILYTIDDGVLLIVVVALGHRREIYR